MTGTNSKSKKFLSVLLLVTFMLTTVFAAPVLAGDKNIIIHPSKAFFDAASGATVTATIAVGGLGSETIPIYPSSGDKFDGMTSFDLSGKVASMVLNITWSSGDQTSITINKESAQSGTWNVWLSAAQESELSTFNIIYEDGTDDTVTNMPTNTTAVAGTSQTVASETPSRDGFTFTGWTVIPSSISTIAGAPFTMPYSDVTFTATWTPVVTTLYDITYLPGTTDSVSGMPANVLDQAVGSNQAVASEVPTRSGYTFAAWTVDVTDIPVIAGTAFLMPAADVTFTATWTPDATPLYDITYLPGTTDSVTGMPANVLDQTASSNQAVASGTPTRSGYTFAAWTVDVTDIPVIAGTAFLMPAANVTFTATWTPVVTPTYDITYLPGTTDSVTGMPANVLDQTAGSNQAVASGTPTRSGYTFAAWTVNVAGIPVSAETAFLMPDANVTFTATWTPVPTPLYDITYLPGTTDSVTGMPTSVLDQIAGSNQAVASGTPTRTGFTFAGWTVNVVDIPIIAGTAFLMPAADVTFTATWTPIQSPTTGSLIITKDIIGDIPSTPATFTFHVEGQEGNNTILGESSTTINGLLPGIYTVTEISLPSYYSIEDPDQIVEIAVGQTAALTFTNTYDRPTSPGGGGSTTYFQVIINYLDKLTNEILKTAYTTQYAEGNEYNLTSNVKSTISGYIWDSADGDDMTGYITSDIEINSYYTAEEEIIETPAPESPIVITTPSEPEEVIIIEPGAPLGELPKTGTSPMPASPSQAAAYLPSELELNFKDEDEEDDIA